MKVEYDQVIRKVNKQKWFKKRGAEANIAMSEDMKVFKVHVTDDYERQKDCLNMTKVRKKAKIRIRYKSTTSDRGNHMGK